MGTYRHNGGQLESPTSAECIPGIWRCPPPACPTSHCSGSHDPEAALVSSFPTLTRAQSCSFPIYCFFIFSPSSHSHSLGSDLRRPCLDGCGTLTGLPQFTWPSSHLAFSTARGTSIKGVNSHLSLPFHVATFWEGLCTAGHVALGALTETPFLLPWCQPHSFPPAHNTHLLSHLHPLLYILPGDVPNLYCF